jgi:lipoprotein-anchoring transpeptidase ErfK/SrfK
MRVTTLLLVFVALAAAPAARLTGLIGAAEAPRPVAATVRLPVSVPAALPAPPSTTVPPTLPPAPVAVVPIPLVRLVPTVTWAVARVRSSGVDVYGEPDPSAPSTHLSAVTEFGTPRVLPVIASRDPWLEVRVPVRPNNAVGWLKASDVDAGTVSDRVYVSLASRQLQWQHGSSVVLHTSVGLGASSTPTPPGEYYVTDIIPSSGAYGPWIVALNGHSDTLTDFGGGDPRIAIHGTDDPTSIGATTSHGCVHVANDVDTQLAAVLKPGTLVEIG